MSLLNIFCSYTLTTVLLILAWSLACDKGVCECVKWANEPFCTQIFENSLNKKEENRCSAYKRRAGKASRTGRLGRE